jgi:cytochrome P450
MADLGMTAAEPRPTSESDGAKVTVEAGLLSVIRSAGVPERGPKPPIPPDAIPGNMSLVEAAVGLVGNLRHGIAYSADVREKYGDIYRTPFIGLPLVTIWDADEIHKIMKNEERVWSTAMGWDALMFEGLDTRSGNMGTLLALDFDDHRVARKLVQPAFTLKAIEGYLAVAERGFSRTVPAWVTRGHVDFKREVRTLLANVAGEIFTGIRDPEKVAIVDGALSDFWHGMMAVTRNPWLSPTFRKARRGFQTLLETFLALVPERRKTGGDDLFSQMCGASTEGLSDEAMVRVFITIMFGAFDTTSAGLTSMAYLLARHPEWQERLREEALRVGSEAPDVSAMKSMKQHEWVWKETLRFMPVNGFLPRRALRDVVVGGYKLAAGTLVTPMNGGIGWHPKWWPEPTKFDPERFSPERAEDKQHPGIFNPFGAGAHACVGMQLANMEMKLFWHRLLTTCRFRLTRDYTARHTFTPMGIVSGNVALTLEPLRA